MSRPKDIGTAAESEVVKACHRAGLPAHRNALAGHLDQGDVHALSGKVVIEVKAGAQTKRVSWKQLDAWRAETDREASRVPACDLGVLVVRRWGSGKAEDWTAHISGEDHARLVTRDPILLTQAAWSPVALRFGALLDLIAAHYGQEAQ